MLRRVYESVVTLRRFLEELYSSGRLQGALMCTVEEMFGQDVFCDENPRGSIRARDEREGDVDCEMENSEHCRHEDNVHFCNHERFSQRKIALTKNSVSRWCRFLD